MSGGTVVRVGDREISLSNLDKVLYPETGTTKGEAIEYYAKIAPVMVPHLAGRCITLKRFPNGVNTTGFFEKRCPKHRPAWIPTAVGPGDRDGDIGYCRFDEPAALVWSANMAALELHVPMAMSDDLDTPLAMVFDFDPGAPAAMKECCEIAMSVREVLAAVDLRGWCKTSGSKGLQMYVPLNTPCTHEAAAEFALAVGRCWNGRTATASPPSWPRSSGPGRSSSTGARTLASRRPSVCTRCGPGPSRPCRRR
jgi:bifunctional non-homologous end joining protein LigD